MFINEAAIVGKTFTTDNSNTEWTCVGYGKNETFIIIGTKFDSVNNRSSLKTFKLSEVSFKGEISPNIK